MMFLPIAFSIRYHITRHIYSRILATCDGFPRSEMCRRRWEGPRPSGCQ